MNHNAGERFEIVSIVCPHCYALIYRKKIIIDKKNIYIRFTCKCGYLTTLRLTK